MSIDLDMDKFAYRAAKEQYLDDVEALIPRLRAFLNHIDCDTLDFDTWMAGEDFLSQDDLESLILCYIRGEIG